MGRLGRDRKFTLHCRLLTFFSLFGMLIYATFLSHFTNSWISVAKSSTNNLTPKNEMRSRIPEISTLTMISWPRSCSIRRPPRSCQAMKKRSTSKPHYSDNRYVFFVQVHFFFSIYLTKTVSTHFAILSTK